MHHLQEAACVRLLLSHSMIDFDNVSLIIGRSDHPQLHEGLWLDSLELCSMYNSLEHQLVSTQDGKSE